MKYQFYRFTYKIPGGPVLLEKSEKYFMVG